MNNIITEPFTKEIVIFRSDLTSRLMRHAIREPKQNLGEMVVKTILSQGHLAPFPQRISPIYWGWDHALECLDIFCSFTHKNLNRDLKTPLPKAFVYGLCCNFVLTAFLLA